MLESRGIPEVRSSGLLTLLREATKGGSRTIAKLVYI